MLSGYILKYIFIRHGTVVCLRSEFADEKRLDLIDNRCDYGEERRVTIGEALGAIFTVVYTMRGPVTWLITAWPANRKERARYGER
ncbi:BrnT family toxin [Methylobacterium indicum]|uniref:BrnT family toxin n=1 Tax=Methylobacterium indicum TaxID=1775910 RepID=UPI001A93938E|nr:BrnT family toxin [Methylobacterium indicum]